MKQIQRWWRKAWMALLTTTFGALGPMELLQHREEWWLILVDTLEWGEARGYNRKEVVTVHVP